MAIAITFSLLAIVPGVYARWSSRELLRSLDDPLLPDKILAHSRRVGSAIGMTIALAVFLVPDYLPALLFVAWLSILAGGFRARRAIFDESWSSWGYLDHSLRFWVGLLGSYVLIALIPSVMRMAGEESLAAGLLFGAAATLWVLGAPGLFRALVRARRLEGSRTEALEPLFSPVIQNAECPPPTLYVAEARGGSWVNAFALPAMRRPGVLFTEGLLSALSPSETAAIFAHEVAHLEHFTPKKVLAGRSLALLLVALPILLWAGPVASTLRGWEWIWPLAFLIAIRLRAGGSQAHESQSDRRAVELGCDPDSLVSALEKLHALLRLSRRWDAAYEKLSTHPSLARRIRAIRSAAGTNKEVSSLSGLEQLFRAADESGRAVRFDASCLHWLRGLPEGDEEILALSEERRTYRYADLSELRLDGRSERRELVVRDVRGTAIRMPVAAEDVSAIEEILDRVDSLLREPAPSEPTPTGRPASLAVLILGLVISLPSISWMVVALAALALARPAEASLLALGAATLATALWRALALDPWWKPLALTAAGAAAFVLAALRNRRKIRQSSLDERLAALVPLALALLSCLGAAAAYLSALPVMRLHLWASETPTVFAGLVAFGFVLASLQGVRARLGAAFAFAAALAFLGLGSTLFRERFGSDLFASAGSPLPIVERSLSPIRETAVPGRVSELLLSPAGSRFGVSIVPPDEEEYGVSFERDFLLETTDGKLRSLRAIDVEYLDEGRILVLEKKEGRAILNRVEADETDSVTPLHEVPLLAGAALESDASGNWQIRGTEWESGTHLVVRGSPGSEPPVEIRFSNDDGLATLTALNRDGVALIARYDYPESFPYLLLLGGAQHLDSVLELQPRDGPSVRLGMSTLQPHCFPVPLEEPRFFCSSFDRGRTGLFSIDPLEGAVQALGHVPGMAYPREVLRGARLALTTWNLPPLLVDLDRRVALRPRGRDLEGAILAWSGNVLAAARAGEDGDETTVSLYTVGR